MRKRLLAFISCMALLLTLCSCGESRCWEPARVSTDIEPYARRAIEIIDEYLSFGITADEASSKCRELYARMIPLDVDEEESFYNEADKVAAKTIQWLEMLSFTHHGDKKLKEYRDILAFQLGDKVSGNVYSARKSVSDSEVAALACYLDLESTPFDFGMVSETSESCFVTLFFETRNGITKQDIKQSIESIFNSEKKAQYQSFYVTVYIKSFDQAVVNIHFAETEDTFSGFAQTAEANDDSVLHNCDTVEDVKKVIEAACAFAGIK